MKQELKPYTTVPRYIPSDYRQGKLTRNEWILYTWMRTNANPYGILPVSIAGLRAEIFPNVTDGYINRLLLNLLSKKYIFFPKHQGRRGAFEVHFDDWLLPNKTIKQLDRYREHQRVRSEQALKTTLIPEEAQTINSSSQKYDETIRQLNKRFSFDSLIKEVRSPYNDTDKEKDKEKKRIVSKISF